MKALKELTIEEKAKRYDEAIEKLHEIITMDNKPVNPKEMGEYLFPELKESEDERIRKLIIKHFKEIANRNEQSWKNLDIPYILAWLEKQNELSIKWNKNTEGNKPAVNHSILMKTTHGISEGEWKGGEYWYQYRWSTNHIKDSDVLAWMELSDLDKQNKSADKVEPKFKVGDWVILTVRELSTTLQITNVDINKKLYWFNDDDCSYLPFVDEECLHLWTIEDAKDGDVLCTYECGEPKIVFIFKNTFKKISKKHCALSYYCYYSIMRHYFVPDSVTGCLGPNVEDIKPATKEQRDVLFSNIKESGYEWDKDKKELSEIR